MTSPLRYGRVEDWAGALILDGLDDDQNPDDVDLTGKATFTPRIGDDANGVRVPNMIPRPKWLSVEPVIVTYANGRLTHRGQNFVMLLSPSSEVNPANWKWEVSFDLLLNGSRITRKNFAFVLPPYDPAAAPLEPGGPNPTIVHLTSVQPIAVPGSGTGIVQGPRGFGVIDAEAVSVAGAPAVQFLVASQSGPVPVGDPVPLPAGGGGGATTVDALTDAGTTGKEVAKAGTAAQARTAIGAISTSEADGKYAPKSTPQLVPDPAREGFFTVPAGSSVTEDPSRPGIFLIGA